MGVKIKRNQKANCILLGDAFEEFMVEKSALNKSASTLHNYRQSFGYFKEFNDLKDDTPIEEIKQSHFYQWVNDMKIEGKKPTTINHYIRDVRAFLYWAMDEDRGYMPKFKVQEMASQEEMPKMFDLEDIEILTQKPRIDDCFGDWRNWAIVSWVMGTGNRAATICEVRLGDISFTKKEIILRHTKNKRIQVIPLSSSLETTIKEYIRGWRQGVGSEAYLFPNIGEEQLTTGALRNSFTRYCQKRGAKRHNIHGLRHNFAANWIKSGGGEYQLQEILGHSDLAMVRHYVKLFSEDLKKNYDEYSLLDSIKKKGKRTQKVNRSMDY